MAWIIAVAAFAVLLILAIDNPVWVGVRFLFWETSLPLVGLVLLAAVLGGAMVGAWAAIRGFRNFRRRRQDHERIQQLESELARAQEQVRYLEKEIHRGEIQAAEIERTDLRPAGLPEGEPGGAE